MKKKASSGLAAFLKRLIDDDAEELQEIKDEVYKTYHIIFSAYQFYAAISKGNSLQVGQNLFSDFLSDCKIPDNGNCDAAVLTNIFVVVNVEDEDDDVGENDTNLDNCMMRFEFFESIIRIGIAKFMSLLNDASDSVSKLCADHIEPNLKTSARMFADDFRYH